MLIFNEFTVSLYLYASLCLTDFMGENSVREDLGWFLLYLVAGTVFVNFVKGIFSVQWRRYYFKIKQKCSRAKKYVAKEDAFTVVKDPAEQRS